GFVEFRLRPWVRRLLTRVLAILPALLTILWVGQEAMMDLLVLSQVILSLQLPFAVVPLLQFTSRRATMGEFVNPPWARVLGWLVAAIIIALNAQMAVSQFQGWITAGGAQASWIELAAVPVAAGCGLLLLWLIVSPWLLAPRPQPEVRATARVTAQEV